MPIDIAVLSGAIALLAILAGVAVKGLLDASRRAHEGDDDVMARAAHVGMSQMPGISPLSVACFAMVFSGVGHDSCWSSQSPWNVW